MKATVDAMAERGFGRVVNITSAAVKAPIDTLGLSNGARAGLTGFVAGLARQARLASRNVTINNLLPGPFDTDRLRSSMAGAAAKTGQAIEALAAARAKALPTQRFGTADEFGAVCAFLCSVQCGYMTGQNVLLDGGGYPGTF
jgi:3-oxoacyl-[acyl-carrier protein] reductase